MKRSDAQGGVPLSRSGFPRTSFSQLDDGFSLAGQSGKIPVVNPSGTAFIPEAIGVIDDHLVLADPVDPSPGTLADKVDNESIIVDTMSHTMHVNFSLINVPVISIYDNSAALPAAPTAGDRYIARVTAHGWTKDNIYTWDGTSWVSTSPVEGAQVVVLQYPIGATTVCSLCVYSFDSTAAAYQWNFVKTYYFLDPIISIFDNTAGLPVAPVIGDRYIALTTANGWIVDNIYQWDETSWVVTVPITGNLIYNITKDEYYRYKNGGETGWASLDQTFPVDSAAVNGSLRTLGTGPLQAAPGNIIVTVNNALAEAAAFAAGAIIVIRSDLL